MTPHVCVDATPLSKGGVERAGAAMQRGRMRWGTRVRGYQRVGLLRGKLDLVPSEKENMREIFFGV
jgi:hypothetical protein